MRITIELPNELIREAKRLAVVRGCTVEGLVAGVLRDSLEFAPAKYLESPPADFLAQIGTSGLPAIRCRLDAPATRMTVQELLKLEQITRAEEDPKYGRIIS